MQNNETFPIKPCTFETIDTGLVEYIKNEFNIHVFTNSGFKKVPVIWVGSERAHQIKSNVQLRDTSGKLKLPLITVQRTSVQKDPSFKGAIQADIRHLRGQGRTHVGGAFRVVSKINQEKTSKRQHALNFGNDIWRGNPFMTDWGEEIVMDEYMVPVPTYVSMTYSITLRCEYQQQMNQMTLPFISRTGQVNHFVFKQDGHRFESFIQQDFSQDNNLSALNEEERKFQTKIDIKVLGYVIGEGVNEPRPKIIKRETVARISVGIETEFTPSSQFSRNALRNLNFDRDDDSGDDSGGGSSSDTSRDTFTTGRECYVAVNKLRIADPESAAAGKRKFGLRIKQEDTSTMSEETAYRLVTDRSEIPGQGWLNIDAGSSDVPEGYESDNLGAIICEEDDT